jgi:hypothetical protein
MNRRTILTGLAVSPIATLPAVAATPTVTPEERINRAARELAAAMKDAGRAEEIKFYFWYFPELGVGMDFAVHRGTSGDPI